MWSTVDMQWDRHVQIDRDICLGAYVNNLKCIPVLPVTLLIAMSSCACKHKHIPLNMYSYIHIYEHTLKLMYDWYRHTDQQTAMHVCLHTFMHICILTDIHACLSTYIHTYLHGNIHVTHIHRLIQHTYTFMHV